MRVPLAFHQTTVGLLFAVVIFSACTKSPEKDTLLSEMLPEHTGISFSNIVQQAGENNVLNYPYYFNGGGVAAGDINKDGLVDIYFSGNQVSNKLYLNKGNFQFEDITATAGVGVETGWKTGVTMVDINLDGWLDIYVCRSALEDSTLRENLLYINNGNLTFTEKAKAFGVADNSYSTHASFFDYDRDGDNDLFVLNHSIPKYAGFNRLLKDFKNQSSTKFGSKLYQNNNGKFKDVTGEAGLINNVLSFGLGIAIADVNVDGWPDLYVSNDFNEEDYLYINQKNGTFKNTIREATGHVSLFSMGSDIADINNDALPDIFTADMLPETNERIKLSSGDDNYDKYQLLINAGFHHQSMRNMLQLNNGNGTFSEIGQLAGISNTDWSWGPLWVDFDGDGWKDLFVSNGYEKDYTNMQFLKFTVDEQIKARQTGTSPNVKLILDNMPAIEVGNYLFKNNGDLTFTNQSKWWGLEQKFKSNGGTYADLDNDGDPDLIVNVINGISKVYRNNTVEKKKANFLTIDLSENTIPLAGTKLYVKTDGKVQHYEVCPSRGFQSSQHTPLYIGLGDNQSADSLRIIWPSGKSKVYINVSTTKVFKPLYKEADEEYIISSPKELFLKEVNGIDWKHKPPVVNDFKRQFLLPKMYSYAGPKLISADVNGDDLLDIYVGAPSAQSGALFVQRSDGSFIEKKNSSFIGDSNYQDEDAVFFDADGDGDNDLYVVSGGYLFNHNDPLLGDRLYINDGKGNFLRDKKRLPVETDAGSCVVPFDIDNDNDLDLFVGNRLIPGQYPLTPSSKILVNDGKGNFTDASETVAPDLKNIGMVCDAISSDLDGDKNSELIIVGEWMPLMVLSSKNGKLTNVTSQWFKASPKGWWNCLLPADFDNDGDVDLMVGNYGLNNQYRASTEHPVTLTFKDFDNDNQIDPFFSYFIGGKSYPYASRDEALSQVSFLKRKFTDYNQYSNATLETIFKPEELKDAKRLDATVLSTMYFENKGTMFSAKALPIEAQFSPVHAMAAIDIDKDGDEDVIMGGNESDVRVRIGKSDANIGQVFLNDGRGNFLYLSPSRSGIHISGDVRSILKVQDKIVVGVMHDSVKIFQIR